MADRKKRALPEDEASQPMTKKNIQAKNFTSRIMCTHILEIFRVKKAFTNLLKIDSGTKIATSRIGIQWRARCQFHDLDCTQEDASEWLAKEKVASSIIHELILRRDPLLDRLPVCHGIMHLPRDEYIEGLIWNVYGDLDKVQIEKRHIASAGGIGSHFKHARVYVNNILYEAMKVGQENATRSVFCAIFSALAGDIAPPREADPALAPLIPTRVSPERAIALLMKLRPTAEISYVPRFTKESIKTWKATVKVNGKVFHAETSEKENSRIQAALLALTALHIVDDPDQPDEEPLQQNPIVGDNPQNMHQLDVSSQTKENRNASVGLLKSELRGTTSMDQNAGDDAGEGRSRSNNKNLNKSRGSSSDNSSTTCSSSSGSSGSSSERSRSASSSSTGSTSSDSSGSSRPPGSDKKRPRKRASSVDSKLRLAYDSHDRSPPIDGLGENLQKNQDFAVRPPPLVRQDQHLRPPEQQPIGPVAIPPSWGQMDATSGMKGPHPSAQLATHLTSPFIARPIAPPHFTSSLPRHYPGLHVSQNSGVSMNNPFHDSSALGQTWNVRYPNTANRFQYSGPPSIINYPAVGSMQYDFYRQQNLVYCDTSVPPPPPSMWLHHHQQQQQLGLQQRPLGFTTGHRVMPPFQLKPSNSNRPVPLVPTFGPVDSLAHPGEMDLRRPQPPSGFPAPRQSNNEHRY